MLEYLVLFPCLQVIVTLDRAEQTVSRALAYENFLARVKDHLATLVPSGTKS